MRSGNPNINPICSGFSGRKGSLSSRGRSRLERKRGGGRPGRQGIPETGSSVDPRLEGVQAAAAPYRVDSVSGLLALGPGGDTCRPPRS